MPDPRLFFDHNAGAPVLDGALEAAVAAARAGGNPSSVHGEGRAARRTIEMAREDVALLAGVAPERVVFTSGATEANLTALSPRVTIGREEILLERLLVGSTEHPSVLSGGRFPPDRVERLAVDGDGVIRLEALAERLARAAAVGERVMVAVQLANSETGVIQPIAEIARLTRTAGGLTHCDAVQGAGRLRLDDPALDVDTMALSAHKIGGLPGTGALILRRPEVAPAVLVPGSQEAGRRGGTQATPGIAAFAVAAAQALRDVREISHVRALRDWIEAEVRSISPSAHVFGLGAGRIANTSMVAVPGVAAETAVIAFDLEGVAISAGSACSSGKVGQSHVAEAMGVGPEFLRSGLRISIGPHTTRAEAERFVAVFARVIGRLARK
ncbi:MAG: aminotransferase class V-fold PLP-dependent enzyme [Siculibacillus sp.]|nr:aminotransferase class V-fold PLP-dependent enzyme [Siculibacillus sp.]